MATPQLGMKRLVYAPKAYVFVHSTTQNAIYNLTPDVVSGEVVRNINQESTATVTLRNRYKKWLRDPDNGKSIFLPMDMITIWLQRIAGKPIQVFTGYLDTVPYYQMYPGDCQLQATCTLKKLSNTYFDPGTTFFYNWMNHLKGWFINSATGEAQNPMALKTQNPNDPNQTINDGGFAQLINDFMVQIANWRPEWVLVDGMNPDIPKIAGALYQKVNKQDEQALLGLQQIMSSVLGINVVPAGTQATPDGPATVPNQIVSSVNTMQTASTAYNVPVIALVTAGQLATHMKADYSTSYAQHDPSDPDGWGYGIFAFKPVVSNGRAVSHVPNGHGGETTIYKGTESKTIEGHTKKQIMSVDVSSQVMTQKLVAADFSGANPRAVQTRIGQYSGKVKNNDAGALKAWIEAALNRTFSQDDFQAALGKAQLYVGAWGTSHPGSATKEPLMTRTVTEYTHLTWNSDEVKKFRTQGDDQQVYKDTYSGHVDDSLAPYYWMARNSTKTLRLIKPVVSNRTNFTLYMGGNSDELTSLYNTLGPKTKKTNGKQALTSVTLRTGNVMDSWVNGRETNNQQGRAPALRDYIEITTPNSPSVLAYPTFDGQKITTKKVPINFQPGAKGNTATTGSSSFGGGAWTAEDNVANSMASAFATQLEFPTNYIESMLLTGYKAFENDMTCMDGITQFCQASLRNFMSLPDGRFLAFYPDYFGAHGRQAYWPIYDIEITNGGVLLSDDDLATHVYVVGDVGAPDGQITWLDEVASRGVVTLDMPLLLRSFIQPGITEQDAEIQDMGWAPGTLRTAFDFYNHFGVRVYKQDVPIIRNTFYEFLYAWQTFMLKWAQTFQTTVTFTFQPEIMAGGIIAFPQHNLQMFVQSVTHTWDYGSGFQTEAELMAPAALNQVKPGVKLSEQDVGGLPGFALGGNTNSVGGVSD